MNLSKEDLLAMYRYMVVAREMDRAICKATGNGTRPAEKRERSWECTTNCGKKTSSLPTTAAPSSAITCGGLHA
jgi:TPP-dependent pyruvate/acetoin dehydrogenase alpha subunit